MNKRRIVLVLSPLLIAGTWNRSAQANLLTNGDFEIPAVVGAPDLPGGSTTLGGWTVLGNDIEVINSSSYSEPENGVEQWNAESGSQSLDLTGAFNTGPTDGISQTIATTPGTNYLVSFWVGAALSTNGSSYYQGPATDDLSINGGTLIPFSSTPVNPGELTWTQGSYQFTAAGSSTSIAFYNGTPLATAEGGLDNVSVTAVPEPVSSVLATLACATVLSRRRRKR